MIFRKHRSDIQPPATPAPFSGELVVNFRVIEYDFDQRGGFTAKVQRLHPNQNPMGAPFGFELAPEDLPRTHRGLMMQIARAVLEHGTHSDLFECVVGTHAVVLDRNDAA